MLKFVLSSHRWIRLRKTDSRNGDVVASGWSAAVAKVTKVFIKELTSHQSVDISAVDPTNPSVQAENKDRGVSDVGV